MFRLKRPLALLLIFLTLAAFAPAVVAGDEPPSPSHGVVTINGVPLVGTTLTVSNTVGTISFYKWVRMNKKNALPSDIGNAALLGLGRTVGNGETYRLSHGDIGMYLYMYATVFNGTSTTIVCSTGGFGPIEEFTPSDCETIDDFTMYFDYDKDDGDYTMTCDGGSGPITIDFDAESIYYNTDVADELKPAFVSFDGGKKWSALKFSIGTAGEPAGFTKFLNKESTIWLTTAIDPKTKQPQKQVTADEEKGIDAVPAAVTYKFAKILARPKLDKFTLDYAKYAEPDDNGFWTLKNSGGRQKVENLQVAYTADGKNPAGGEYGRFDGGRMRVQDQITPGKVDKHKFLVRVAPTTNSAGSKPKKYNVSSLLKAPAIKIDYKKEVIKLKAGMLFGDADVVYEDDADGDTCTVETTRFWSFWEKPLTKDSKYVKDGFPLAEYWGADLGARTAATEKKPASVVQGITVKWAEDIYESEAVPTVKGTSVKLPKGYEACLLTDMGKPGTKWTASIKAESATYAVRYKNTAKHTPKTNTTTGIPACGIDNIMLLDVATGKDAKGKTVVTAATYIVEKGDISTAGSSYGVFLNSAADAVQNLKMEGNPVRLDISMRGLGNKINIVDDAPDDVYIHIDDSDPAYDYDDVLLVYVYDTLTEDTTVTITFEPEKGPDEEFYSATITVNITVDNNKIVTADMAGLTADEFDFDNADNESEVRTAIKDVLDDFDTTCDVSYEIDQFTAGSSLKVTFTFARGDVSKTKTLSWTLTA